MRPHLPEEELHAWLDGQLSRAQSAELAEHLLSCLICRALEAEVRELRDRSIQLLAAATPRSTRLAPPVPRTRRLRSGTAAVAAAVLIGVGSWAVVGNQPTQQGAPQLAASFVAPAILAKVVGLPISGADSAPVGQPVPSAAPSPRTITLASRVTVSPRVIPARATTPNPAARKLRLVDPILDMGQGGAWQTSSLQQAREASEGAVAYLQGIPVSAVRLQQDEAGGKPTAMVRQLLPDGRAVWVIEGTGTELEQLHRVLEASGLSFSTPRRARFDYAEVDGSPVRIARMVTIASHLPPDSLDALVQGRLKLD